MQLKRYSLQLSGPILLPIFIFQVLAGYILSTNIVKVFEGIFLWIHLWSGFNRYVYRSSLPSFVHPTMIFILHMESLIEIPCLYIIPSPSFPDGLTTLNSSKFQNICCLLTLDFDPISIKSCFISCLIICLDVSHKLTHIFEKFLPTLW